MHATLEYLADENTFGPQDETARELPDTVPLVIEEADSFDISYGRHSSGEGADSRDYEGRHRVASAEGNTTDYTAEQDRVDPIKAYSALTSPGALAHYETRIRSELGSFDAQATIADIVDEATKARQSFVLLDSNPDLDDSSRESVRQHYKTVSSELAGREDRARHLGQFMSVRDSQWNRNRMVMLETEDPVAVDIMQALRHADPGDAATFVPEEGIKRTFNESQPALYLTAIGNDKLIAVPAAAVVSAAGLRSWQEGRGHTLKNGAASSEVIRDYAARGAESAPPLDEGTAAVFPDGTVQIISSSAHRMAAAKMRGDELVVFKSLKVIPALGQ